MAENIIQLGMFTADDHLAYVHIGGQWIKVPAWLWCEWEFDHTIKGLHGDITYPGVFGIIKYYHLDDIPFRAHEATAIYNVARQGRAMRQYWLYGDTGVLGELEHLALRMERYVLEHSPHLKGQPFYERVAALMGNNLSWRQAKAVIEDATGALIETYESNENAYYERLAKRIHKLNARIDAAA